LNGDAEDGFASAEDCRCHNSVVGVSKRPEF
jgi:hypothetical protein